MIMKLTNKQIYETYPVIQTISKCKLPVKQAYKLKKNIDKLGKQAEFIENERKDLIKKHGKECDNGDFEINKNDISSLEKFFDDWEALTDIEEDVEIRTLTLDELENIELSIEDLNKIEFMIIDPEIK